MVSGPFTAKRHTDCSELLQSVCCCLLLCSAVRALNSSSAIMAWCICMQRSLLNTFARGFLDCTYTYLSRKCSLGRISVETLCAKPADSFEFSIYLGFSTHTVEASERRSVSLRANTVGTTNLTLTANGSCRSCWSSASAAKRCW